MVMCVAAPAMKRSSRTAQMGSSREAVGRPPSRAVVGEYGGPDCDAGQRLVRRRGRVGVVPTIAWGPCWPVADIVELGVSRSWLLDMLQ